MYRMDVRGLGVRIGGAQILSDVDLSLKSGELVVLLGPSGSGKSTLLKAMIAFTSAQGKVQVCGRDLRENFAQLKRLIGYVPQDDILHGALRVQTALRYTAKLRLDGDSDERVQDVLTQLELTDRRRVRIKSLSGGQRKRVAIATELLAKPPLLFLDEPTSGLDPALEEQMMRLFRALTDEGRITVVTTHILASLELADLAVIVVAGRVVYVGPPSQVLDFFEVPDITQMYKLLAKTKPQRWVTKLQASAQYRSLVTARLAAPPPQLPREDSP